MTGSLLHNPTYSAPEPRFVDILLADEMTLVREGLAALCNSVQGFFVVAQVGTAAGALAEIERLRPAIALLDLGLSDLAATEVIRRVREQDLPTRCAVFSSRKDRKTVLEVLRAGACGYLLKSSSYEQMAEALAQFTHGGIYVSPQIEVMSLFGDGHRREVDPIESLSSREFQVFSLLVEGVRAKEIAARLSLSPKTVDTYRSSLMRKLDIHDVAGLVKFAIKRDLAYVQAGASAPEVERLCPARIAFAIAMPPLEAVRAWMLLPIEYCAGRTVICCPRSRLR